MIGFTSLIEQAGEHNQLTLEDINSNLDRIQICLPQSQIIAKKHQQEIYMPYDAGRGIPTDEEIKKQAWYEHYEKIMKTPINVSDTVILFIECREEDTKNQLLDKFQAICIATSMYISKMVIKMQSEEQRIQFASRAAVSYGDAIIKTGDVIRLIGQAYLDAYRLSEDSDWMGGVIHPSVHGAIPIENIDKHLAGHNNVLFRWDVPLKKETKKLYAINWVRFHPLGNEWKPSHHLSDDWYGPYYKDIGRHVETFFDKQIDYLKKKYEASHEKKDEEELKKLKRKKSNTANFIKIICDAFLKEYQTKHENTNRGVAVAIPTDAIPLASPMGQLTYSAVLDKSKNAK